MRVMTFNLRFENELDGENAWNCRRDIVIEVVHRCAPSILGTQEGTLMQLDFLQEHLSGYRMHAPGRVLDETCQYPTLFYREEEFRALSGGEFWLSKTPAAHRSKDWDSAFPRMVSYGLFEELPTGRNVCAAVTHLDHIGKEARKQQAKIIVEWMLQQSEPCILMGDFNDTPASEVHEIITHPNIGLRDTWQILCRCEGRSSMTHHGFLGIPQRSRLDWILVGCQFDVIDAKIVYDHHEGRYPSDHFPYVTELKWRNSE